jgi:ribosomal protein L11 methyltransferase
MSFGTGHHETTHMMIQFLLKENLHGKTVLDMGCGTGVLAIIAEKLGAESVHAIDIDSWSYENCIENAVRNKAELITVQRGDASLLRNKHFDVIIANINRNILLEDMGIYVKCLNSNGVLLLSGFYKEDIPLIVQSCHSFMLKLVETIEREQWVALKFIN